LLSPPATETASGKNFISYFDFKDPRHLSAIMDVRSTLVTQPKLLARGQLTDAIFTPPLSVTNPPSAITAGDARLANLLAKSFTQKTTNDLDALKLALIVQVGLDTKITKEAFAAAKENDLAESLYQEAIAHYEYKKKDMMQNSIPVFKNIRTQEGKHIENVIVPVSDGKTVFNVLVNLDKNLDTKGAALATEFEKSISLSLIDDAWKEHLRAMDDLKQSVQTATYEQKDPLVIYKMEAFELFRKMDIEINHKMVQFLCHAHIPLEANEVKEGRQQKTDLSKLSANRTEDGTPKENEYHDPSASKQAPISVGPKIGRNDPCPCGSGKKYKACHGKDMA
jgi:preprotein translocase subunit SecA